MPDFRLGVKRQCYKHDDSRGVAGCVTQLLWPLPHIQELPEKEDFCTILYTLCGGRKMKHTVTLRNKITFIEM